MEDRNYTIIDNSLHWNYTDKLMESIVKDDSHDKVFTVLSHNVGSIRLPKPSLMPTTPMHYVYRIPAITIKTNNDNAVLFLKAWLSVKQRCKINVIFKPFILFGENDISIYLANIMSNSEKDLSTEELTDEYFNKVLEFMNTVRLLFKEFITLVNTEN